MPVALKVMSPADAPGEKRRPLDVREVHESYAGYVWQNLQRLGVPEADLEDCLQDVFIVVHRRRADFDPTHTIKSWLFAICLRVARQRRRRAHTWRESLVEEIPDRADDEETRPDGRLEHDQERRWVHDVLDQMDLERRVVLTMFELEERSGLEIAECLGVPVGTVHSRIHAARREFEAIVHRMRARQRGNAP